MRRVTSTCVLTLLMGVQFGACGNAGEAATSFFAKYFETAESGQLCFGRTYDDAHLSSHTQQKVRRIEIDMDKTDANGRTNTAERFELGIAVMTRTSAEWYGQVAICKAARDAADCFLDGDGGLFKLTPAADGGLRLETGSYGLSFEGEKDFLELSATNGDDRAFLLKRGTAECDAANLYFGAEAEKAQ